MNTYLIYIFVILLSSSRLSILQMQSLGISLLAKLKAEPVSIEITAMITRLETTLTLYLTVLTQWSSDKSRTKGKVDAFSKIVLTIPFLIDSYKTMVKTAMPGDTNVLLVLFGNSIAIFYNGKQQDIINAFQNLFKLLDDYPLLAALQIKVGAFIVNLQAAYDVKAEIKDDVKIDSSTITDLHNELGSIILGTFGRLIDFFRTNPFKVERFFDPTIIKRNKKDPEKVRKNQAWVDVPFGITINASNTKIIKNGYFVFEGFTDATVCIWTAPTSDSPVPPNVFELKGTEKNGAKVNDLGSALNTFLLFKVKTGVTPGRIKVTWRNKK